MRAFYLASAAVCFALAVLGVVLPVLPTTPFLLLTSFCLVRSSPRLNAKLRRSPLFGPFLADWEAHHGVRLHVKIAALSMLAIAVTLSLALGDLSRPVQLLLLALAAAGAFVVLRLKTIRDEV